MPAIPRVNRLKPIYSAASSLPFGWQMTGFPTAPQHNGWNGRAIPQLHRVTIRFCRKDYASAGVRRFINEDLVEFARRNPATAIYVMPGRQCIPSLRGEYANGRQVHINAKNFTNEDMCRHMNDLRSRSGEPIVRMLSAQTASVRSLQGEWTPLTWLPSEQNVAWSQLPQVEFSTHQTAALSAQDYILLNSMDADDAAAVDIRREREVATTTREQASA